MDRRDIVATLRANEAELRKRGVCHAALFGSRAQGDHMALSDTDILVELDPAAHLGVWGYVGVKRFVASLFEVPVDVVNRAGLKPYAKTSAVAYAIYAF